MSKTPSILVCGKNKICADTLEIIRRELPDHTIVHVYADKDEISARVAREAAHRLGIESRGVRDSEAFARTYFEVDPTLLLSVQFSIILRHDIIERGSDRLINLHFSPLPRYRGMAPITLAILNGDATFGVSLHIIDAGIDTGALVDQETFAIAGRSNREVYSLCEQAGVRLIERNAAKFGAITATRGLSGAAVVQDDAAATYFSKADIDYARTEIDFRRTAAQIDRHVRAYLFPPNLYARITVGNRRLRVLQPPEFGARCTDRKPGLVVRNDPLTVTSRDRILIFRQTEEEA
ncbi:formyltransferase family protein [Methylobacterium sp. NMS12]|uniref:formyltransferase family protein n=1 Tax=Methylobacterium sp. NMS12 TaxID=3079766 RepID=UPI003F883358